MKTLQRTLVALSLCALLAMTAFAGGKDKIRREAVTFGSDIMVNGTLVKAGAYEVSFNETTGELAILKDGKVKAKTTAHYAPRNDKAGKTAVRTLVKDNVAELVGVSFGGAKQELLVGAGGGAVTGN
jgi:hypothetical protein